MRGWCVGPAVAPGLEMVERVDDATADLSIGGARAVGPVFFQRPARETEEQGSFGRAQVTRRQAGVGIGHWRSSVIVWSAGADGGALAATIAERTGKEGCRRTGDKFSIPRRLFYFLRAGGRSNAR